MNYEKFKVDFLNWAFEGLVQNGENSYDWYDNMNLEMLVELREYLSSENCFNRFMDYAYTTSSRDLGHDFFVNFAKEVDKEIEHRDWVTKIFGLRGLQSRHR